MEPTLPHEKDEKSITVALRSAKRAQQRVGCMRRGTSQALGERSALQATRNRKRLEAFRIRPVLFPLLQLPKCFCLVGTCKLMQPPLPVLLRKGPSTAVLGPSCERVRAPSSPEVQLMGSSLF